MYLMFEILYSYLVCDCLLCIVLLKTIKIHVFLCLSVLIMAEKPDNHVILSWIEEDGTNKFDISFTDTEVSSENNGYSTNTKQSNTN